MGNQAEAALAPWQIKTLTLTKEGLKECDMLERPARGQET